MMRLSGTTGNEVCLSERPRVLWAGKDFFRRNSEEVFQLANVWTLHLYYYSANIIIDGENHEIFPNSIGLCPPYSKLQYHTYKGHERLHYAFEFQLPSIQANSELWKFRLITQLQDPKAAYFKDSIQNAVDAYEALPLKTEVGLWSVLLNLTKKVVVDEENAYSQSVDDQRIAKACAIIDMHLGEAVYPQVLADSLGISVTHLGRLFKRHLDCPVATYIRRRRAQRAHELLVFTEKPINEIASLVGVSSLPNFNRLVKSEFSLSPRDIRERDS